MSRTVMVRPAELRAAAVFPVGWRDTGAQVSGFSLAFPPLPVLVLELALGVARGPTRKVRVSDKFG